MNRVRLAAAACALLFASACSAGPYSDAAQQPDSLTAGSSGTPPRSQATSTRPANQHRLDNGLAVTLSAPKSFTPTDAASPRSPRAVAFDLLLENGSGASYHPSQLSILGLIDGRAAAQVVDSTQGYTGFVGATDEVRPGESVRVTVAFAVPMDRVRLSLTVRPDAMDTERITLFEGTV